MKISISTIILCFFALTCNAQVTPTPAFPSDNLPLEIIFNASSPDGNNGLAGYTGDVYTHTGVITNLSTGPSNWKYVKTTWGLNTPETKLERIGVNQYKFTTGTKSIREFYGVPESEQIQSVAFVFRSATLVGGSYKEGKTKAGGDIFVEVYAAGLFVNITAPVDYGSIVAPGENITIQASASVADSIFLLVDNSEIISLSGKTLSQVIVAEATGKHYIKVLAKSGNLWASDSSYYYVSSAVTTMSIPQGMKDGINYINESTVILSLYAPYKNNAFVIGDFTNWEYSDEGFMYRTPDGNRYWKQIDGLTPGKEYAFQYLVDGQIRIADPYTDKVLDPWNDQYIPPTVYPNLLQYPAEKTNQIASVLQTGQVPYQWTTSTFIPPAKTDLVIYELLLRDFIAGHNYQMLIDTLSYLKRLGVNAIELMPVYEFEGNSSWGYNTAFHFAPDKYYGTKNDLKEFIDVCHQEGIAVIFDIVLNHVFGSSPFSRLYWDATNNRPAANNPWLNPVAKHDYNVGYDFNHESQATKDLVDRVVKYWVQEYKVDGYRFDLSKGFTQRNTLGNVSLWGQYDLSRVALWKTIANSIWAVNPQTYVILEHFADNAEEKELANYGMMIWGNMNYSYAQSAMAKSDENDVSWGSYKARGWDNPNLVTYMESHDEERMMFRLKTSGTMAPFYNTRVIDTALNRVALASAFFYTIPGPKMIWQFEELGYDHSIEENGRLSEKPIRWDYKDDYKRQYLYEVTAALIKLKKEQDVFRTTNFTATLAGFQKNITLIGNDMTAVVLGNFDINTAVVAPGFTSTGKWYEFFTHDSITVTSLTDRITMRAGEYRLYTNKQLQKPETSLGLPENPSRNNSILGAVYPSPSSGTIYIPVNLKSSGPVNISIYNSSGQLVDMLEEDFMVAGTHTIERKMIKTTPGLYLLRIETRGKAETVKFLSR